MMDMEDIGGGSGGERREMVTPAASCGADEAGVQNFGVVSGVKLCRWTKARSCAVMRRVLQAQLLRHREPPVHGATPSLACANKCVFCWRHHTNPVGREWRWQMDDAETLVTSAISEHKGMIKQMKGVPGVLPERLAEGMDPRHCALSLVGEPIMYPEIDKFVSLLHAEANKHVPGHERAVPRTPSPTYRPSRSCTSPWTRPRRRRSRLSTDRCSGLLGT